MYNYRYRDTSVIAVPVNVEIKMDEFHFPPVKILNV